MELARKERHHRLLHLAVGGGGGEGRCCQLLGRGIGSDLGGDATVVDDLGGEVDLGLFLEEAMYEDGKG